jgi:hypothetical protein
VFSDTLPYSLVPPDQGVKRASPLGVPFFTSLNLLVSEDLIKDLPVALQINEDVARQNADKLMG